jgi:hypothetical protein
MKSWVSTTSIAMLLCLVGCGSLLLPWAQATVMTFDPVAQADGSYKLKSWLTESYLGYRFWHASVSALALLGLFLFLLVTSPIRPVPWWRSAAALIDGAGIIIIVLVGLNYRYDTLESDLERGRAVLPSWSVVNYLAMGLAAGIMMVAGFELRSRIAGNGHKRDNA